MNKKESANAVREACPGEVCGGMLITGVTVKEFLRYLEAPEMPEKVVPFKSEWFDMLLAVQHLATTRGAQRRLNSNVLARDIARAMDASVKVLSVEDEGWAFALQMEGYLREAGFEIQPIEK
jgi:hypothetical protein